MSRDLAERVRDLLATPCDCPVDYTARNRHAPDCRWQFVHDFLDDNDITATVALLAESTPAAPDEEGLDAAWAAAEAALGEYWRVRSLVEVKDGWEAVATDGNRIAHVAGPTPLAALRALARGTGQGVIHRLGLTEGALKMRLSRWRRREGVDTNAELVFRYRDRIEA
jgi:hypothetical protein